MDPNGDLVSAVGVKLIRIATNEIRFAQTNSSGTYYFTGLPIGEYRAEVSTSGYKTQVIESMSLSVAENVSLNFRLIVGDISELVVIGSDDRALDRNSLSNGTILGERVVQDLPLNGRYFLDLANLTLGSVTPPQGAFSASPMRGAGSLAVNTAGNREETVNYVVNGITLNNLTSSSITFQLPISVIHEFRLDNSAFSAEFGQSSGSIVNVATRSAGNQFHGEVFNYVRNDLFDARNFFEFASRRPAPFKRNQFGFNFGGPIAKDRIFALFSYEGLRQRQGLNLNSVVLSDNQRAAVVDPVIKKLIDLIPRPNFTDSAGTPRFLGTGGAPVNIDNLALDMQFRVSQADSIHAFYDLHLLKQTEPSRFGITIPGFGYDGVVRRQILTINHSHIYDQNTINNVRLGFNRLYGANRPRSKLNPASIGIRNGIDESIGLPQIDVAGGALNFGGPSALPAGRGDTTLVFADTLSFLTGRHDVRVGGEYRNFYNNSFRQGTGLFRFPTVSSFLAGNANFFSITLGSQTSSVSQKAVGFFVQDNIRIRSDLNFSVGMRYDWNVTPTERFDRFVVFDVQSAELVRLSNGDRSVYGQNAGNIQPRVGIAWNPLKNRGLVIRAAYGIAADQPMTNVVNATALNPPLATPLAFAGTIRLDNAISLAQATGLAPQSVDPNFQNAYVQSWNLGTQYELLRNFSVRVGYMGSKGTHLITRRNINQPSNGTRPFPALSGSSSILPGRALGNISQVESTGNSNYHALWVAADRRLSKGLTASASYTFSKSLDYSSSSTQGVFFQDSYDLRSDCGLSDFDAKHRFVFSTIYELPLGGNRFADGWQLSAIVQSQSGNPFSIVTAGTINGISGTLRPDVAGKVKIIGTPDRWFDTQALVAVNRSGNLGRNVLRGPSFNNADVSVIKNTRLRERVRLQLRMEVFNVFNVANFGRPGNLLGSPSFGRVTSTRFPTGETGSSRQIQFAIRLSV